MGGWGVGRGVYYTCRASPKRYSPATVSEYQMFKTSTDVTIKATYALQKVIFDSHEQRAKVWPV